MLVETLNLLKPLVHLLSLRLVNRCETKLRHRYVVGLSLFALRGALQLERTFEPSHDWLKGTRQISYQVPAIGNLDRLRGSQSSSFRRISRTVTTDHFHPWMLLEPCGKAFGSPVGQKIDHTMSLQIA